MAIPFIDSGKRLLERSAAEGFGRTAVDVGVGAIDPVDQPQLGYMWEVEFNGIFSTDAKNMKFYALSTAIPTRQIEVHNRWYNGVGYSYSGKESSPETIRITFWDNQDLEVYRYFHRWMNTMGDTVAHRKVNPRNYRRAIKLNLKDTSDLLINEFFVFEGVFPVEIGEVSLSYEESNLMTFDVTLNYEDMLMNGSRGEPTTDIINSLSNQFGDVLTTVGNTASNIAGKIF